MSYHRLLIVVCFLIANYAYLNCSQAQINRPYFKHLTRDEGLSSNKINCIAEDKFGFIWLGTEEGLSRYDGVRFKIFKSVPGLNDNYVNSIAADPANGNLWIGTRKGICFFNRKLERFYPFSKDSGLDSVTRSCSFSKVFLDSRKRLWVAGLSGLYCISYNFSTGDGKNGKVEKNEKDGKDGEVQAVNLLGQTVVNDVFEDSHNRIWIGSNKKLFLYDPKENLVKTCNTGVKNIHVRSINEDSRKNIWVSTRNKGIILITPQGTKILHLKKGTDLKTNNVTGVAEDEKGRIWIGARDGGGIHTFGYGDKSVAKLSSHSNVPDDPNSITSNGITAVFKDKKGYIWIGTYAGLNYYDPFRKSFAHYKVNFEPDGIFTSNISCFFQDSEGLIWVGTSDAAGISMFNPDKGSFINYKSNSTQHPGLTDGVVLSITEINKNNLLIGTNNSGLFIFNKSTETFRKVNERYSGDPSISPGRITKVYRDQFGIIWVASTTTLYQFDLRTETLKPKIRVPSVREMLEYDKDIIYFATSSSGLIQYSRKSGELKSFVNKPGTNSLSNDQLNAVKKDRFGNLWIASNNGLNHFDVAKKRFKVFGTRNGLPTDIICGILIDNKDNLWLSTVNGIVKFSFSSSPFKISTFNVYDGLQANEFEKGVCLRTAKGSMLFGGINGFNYFSPDSIVSNSLVPSVVLTDFKIFNKSVSIASDDSPFKQSIHFEKAISLDYNQNFLEIEFAGLSFTSPEKDLYAYKLDGLESDWNISGTKTSASYTGLPPGTYTFRVRASNNDRIWSPDEASLKIEILPPWWKTVLFQVFVLVAVIVLTAWFFYYRTQSLRMQKRKLDLLVRERTEVIRQQNKQLEDSRDQVISLNSKIKAINEYKLQYFTNISHEFRTPLTLIINPVDKLLSEQLSETEAKENLLVVKKNTGRLLHLINELMDFRSLENKNLPLTVNHIELSKLTEDISGLFMELARQKRIEFSVEHLDENVEGWADANKLQKVIFNLIANAFNYTDHGGTITIRTRKLLQIESSGKEVTFGKVPASSLYFEFCIKDSGIGIPQENLTKVFKQFYRESITNRDTKGTGLGLSIVKELVLLHKGMISVKSEPGHGSEFKVTIPVSGELYAPAGTSAVEEVSPIYTSSQVIDLLGSIPQNVNVETNSTAKGMEHILIVEDNEELLNFISQQLSPGYKVTKARNGAEGLNFAIKYTPDVIVSDVIMPEMDGVELCRRLKENMSTTHIPVILLTAKADVESQIEGIDVGADDYISKPFAIEVFKLKIRNLIASRIKLRQLFSSSVDDIPVRTELTDPDTLFLEKVISIIKENLSNQDFGVNQLVDEMCVSISQLQKKLSRLTNHSPSEFIMLHRMKKSLELIRQPGMTITELATMVGFQDPFYFSRCFKKHFGKSPKAFAETVAEPLTTNQSAED